MIRSCAARFTATTASHLSGTCWRAACPAGCRRCARDVEPAVPCAGVLEDPGARVVGGHVELQRRALDLVRDPGERLARSGHVHHDDLRAVARERPGDLRPDAAGRARDDGDLAGERLVEVGGAAAGGAVGRARAHPEELAVDERGLRREEEPEGREDARAVDGGVVGHLDAVGGRPVAQLLATDRRNPSTPSRAAASSGSRCRRGARDRHDAAVRREAAERRGERHDGRGRVLRPLDPAEHDDDRAPAGRVVRGLADVEVPGEQGLGDEVGVVAHAGRAAEHEHGPDGERVARAEAAQDRRARRPSFLASVFVKPELTAWT